MPILVWIELNRLYCRISNIGELKLNLAQIIIHFDRTRQFRVQLFVDLQTSGLLRVIKLKGCQLIDQHVDFRRLIAEFIPLWCCYLLDGICCSRKCDRFCHTVRSGRQRCNNTSAGVEHLELRILERVILFVWNTSAIVRADLLYLQLSVFRKFLKDGRKCDLVCRGISETYILRVASHFVGVSIHDVSKELRVERCLHTEFFCTGCTILCKEEECVTV